MRVLMLVHVRELVAQNAQALLRLWPQAPVGIYSAGLGRRDTSQRIIFASVQSVYRRAK
jgi:DNA repair protein RadD